LNVSILIAQKTNRNLDFEMFEIFKSKIESGLFKDLKSSKIGGNHFRDYVYIALNVNEDKWAEEFIENYSHYLPKELKENNINTAKAFLYLKRKNYDDAVKYIKKLNRKFHIHDLDFYTIQIFAAYDSGNIVECLRVYKIFKEYLNNNSSFPGNIKKGPVNFLKILRILISYKETGNKYLLNEIEQTIENTGELYWKGWISEKVAEGKSKFQQI
jgi:tetratricopeptide (TPR) repeat protein